ncbi:hypothetical protein [Mucilaginibacter pedocola]|uniref:hypothetical protein n=1 Tax=Mucilaginibacter pedocola TaxID=1792845 RepID=UPI00117D544C|nr:hypothetical protein [Mucilaginibacter pedocola]
MSFPKIKRLPAGCKGLLKKLTACTFDKEKTLASASQSLARVLIAYQRSVAPVFHSSNYAVEYLVMQVKIVDMNSVRQYIIFQYPVCHRQTEEFSPLRYGNEKMIASFLSLNSCSNIPLSSYIFLQNSAAPSAMDCKSRSGSLSL